MKRIFLLINILFFSFINGLFAQLPPDFIETVVTSDLDRPVGITFDENGQAYVWERSGIVEIIDSSGVKLPNPLIDISEEVGNWGDHGCLGFALHPEFLSNGYFYLLYVVDRHHLLHFGTNQYDPDSSLTHQATIGRITRYTADPSTNFQTTLPNSRKILLGESIDSGFPVLMASHGVGALAFGTDGTLLASCGEAGSFLSDDAGSDENTYYEQALADGIIREKENVGSFRAQLVDCLNGKIIRIDAETGDGISGNPYFDSENRRSAASRVWVLGLRNPFRFIVRPESGSHNPEVGDPGDLFIGDVGGNKWEELIIASEGGQNFGHPFFEGFNKKQGFWNLWAENKDAPNPLYNINSCNRPYFYFQELIKQANPEAGETFQNPCNPQETIDPNTPAFYHSLPKLAYSNSLGNKPNRALIAVLGSEGGVDTMDISLPGSPVSGEPFGGYSTIAGCFYNGENFPEEYRGKYFHADYSWWIRVMDFDENNDFQTVERFHDQANYILSMAVNPKDGCLYYVNFQKKIMKISYGGNAPPVAIAKFDNQFGPSPHLVNFDASESYDPDGTVLSFYWDFGDGMSSEERDPQHIFETPSNDPTPFNVVLTVTDSLGATSIANLTISLNNTPPEVEIISFEDGDFYPVTGFTILPLEAEVFDAEHDKPELEYEWQTFLQHNTHDHAEPVVNEESTTILIEPVGCSGENYWYRIVLKVTDAAGLVGSDTSDIFPFCGDPPAELKNWRAIANERTVDLSWETGLETNLAYFEVQKMDNINFVKTIGEVAAKGNNSTYQFIDDAPIYGINIYRLKMVRDDGVYDYSSELKVLFPPKPEINVYPNPASDKIFIELKSATGENNLEFFNYAGQLVSKVLWMNSNKKEVDVSAWPNGVYFYNLKNGSKNYKGSLLILR
jgi:glucose/arabinose dehydrogenase